MSEQARVQLPQQQLVTALILAGRRGGPDELAIAAGAPHRAFLDIDGEPMLQRVVKTLKAVPAIGRIVVSTDRPDLLKTYPSLADAVADGSITVRTGNLSVCQNVVAALEALGDLEPLLVTTADHALLTPAIVENFLRQAGAAQADLAFGLVAASRVRARFPQSQRTYIPFRDDGYSGANLFAFLTPASRRGAEFWTTVEEERKSPWRLARAFGWKAFVLFLLRRLDLAAAMRRASRVVGARIAAISLPFAEAAVDVDRMSDLLLVREVLSGAPPAAAAGVRGH